MGILCSSNGKESACDAEEQKTMARSLSREDPLEKGMAIYSSILAWRIPWAEKPDGLQSMGCKQSDMTERLTLSLFI